MRVLVGGVDKMSGKGVVTVEAVVGSVAGFGLVCATASQLGPSMAIPNAAHEKAFAKCLPGFAPLPEKLSKCIKE